MRSIVNLLPAPFTLKSDNRRRYRAAFALINFGVVAWVVIIVAILVNGHQYKVTTVASNVYEVKVMISPQEAEGYSQRMEKLLVPMISTCDVKLPNGAMVCAVIERSQAEEIMVGGQAQEVVTRWDLSDPKASLIYEDLNLMVTFCEVSYADLCEAASEAKAAKEAFCVLQKNVYLADGRCVEYRIPTSDADGYVRRMHRIGATRLILPFYYNLDSSQPCEVQMPYGIY